MSHTNLRPFIVKVSVLGYFPLYIRLCDPFTDPDPPFVIRSFADPDPVFLTRSGSPINDRDPAQHCIYAYTIFCFMTC